MPYKLKPSGIILIIIGIVAIIWSLLADQNGWVGFEPGSVSQLTLALAGIFLVWLGIAGRRFSLRPLRRTLQPIAIVIINTLIALLVIELLITISVNIKNQVVLGGRVWLLENDERDQFPYYQAREWGTLHWQEYTRSEAKRYEPFSLWRRRAFTGETINVNADGIRLTPGSECEPDDAFRLFVFGGSTIWGHGSPDDSTIPAYLVAEYAPQSEQPLCIVNYGEDGYVTTQDFVTLAKQLQNGNIPDAVIFYGPINNISTALASGTDAHQGADGFENLFRDYPALQTTARAISGSYTANFLRQTLGLQPDPTATRSEDTDLLDETVSHYLNTYNLVDALAQSYGFEYAFFVQPSMTHTEKSLNDIETDIRTIQQPQALQNFEQAVYDELIAAADAHPNMHLLLDIFDETTEHIWIDWVHITPTGNEIAAAAIANQFNPFESTEE